MDQLSRNQAMVVAALGMLVLLLAVDPILSVFLQQLPKIRQEVQIWLAELSRVTRGI